MEHVTASWDFARDPTGSAILLEVGRERGHADADLLSGTGLTVAGLADPDTVVEAGQELQLARNLVTLTGDPPGLGADAGRRHRLTTLGIWGFVVITSPTMLAALQTGLRYAQLSSAFIRPELEIGPRETRITLHADEIPADVRTFLTERDVTAVATVLPEILGPEVMDVLRVSAGATIIAETRLLHLPMPQADPTTRQAVEQACERLLEVRARSGVASRVRARLLERPDRMPALQELADELHLDVRTLRRHLAAEDTSYRQLREEVATALATELLQTVGLTVGETAHRLGYADATAFTHAFKRWTGRPPSALRARG